MTEKARILVVDDEPNITELVSMALRYEGFEVEVASDGRSALAKASTFRPHLMVLDVMLPAVDGFGVLKRIRADGQPLSVVFLTARDATEDAVRGLTLGGDGYIRKPFSVEEIVAQIRALLRRTGRAAASTRLSLADLEIDDDAHVVRKAGQVVELSPTEYSLLRFLLVNAGRVMSRSQILDHVWQYDFGGNGTVVETYISYLRKKLDGIGQPLIKTVRGVGYSLRVD